MLKRLVLLILVAAGLTGLLLYSQTREELPVVSGFIEADEIRLGSRIGGRVKEVLVNEGAEVDQGEILLRFEEFDLDEKQAQATAELQARQAELKQLLAGFRQEEIAQAAARVERLKQKHKALEDGPRPEERAAAKARQQFAKAQLDLAQITYNRNLALFERDRASVSREALDRSVEELRSAQANKEVRDQELLLIEKGTRAEDIAAARAEMTEAEQALLLTKNGSRPEEIEQAKAAVAAAQAALAILEAHREELTVKAPVAGYVEAIDLRAGDLVGAGAPVMSVIDTHQLWVRAYVPQRLLGVRQGQILRVTVDSFPGESFEGEITYISRQAEFTPSNVQTPEERAKQVFRVKVTMRTGLDKLRAGMAADVWLRN
jgi:multidrug resistance efflux pump